jgi:hypothetical protein
MQRSSVSDYLLYLHLLNDISPFINTHLVVSITIMKTVALSTDGPSRRLWALALLAGLQAIKLYDFYTIRAAANPQLATFLVKWLVFETCYIYVLPYFNIPWLQFRRSSQLLQIAFVLILNWGLSFGWEVVRDSGIGLGSIWAGVLKGALRPVKLLMLVFYNKELGISEKYVDVGSLLRNNSHIQGRKVVRILPERWVLKESPLIIALQRSILPESPSVSILNRSLPLSFQ